MKAASAKSLYAFSVCPLFAIRAALLVLNDVPLRGYSRKYGSVRVAAVNEDPSHALACDCILQSDTCLTVAQKVGCAGHVPRVPTVGRAIVKL
jgi:hypothetical protein